MCVVIEMAGFDAIVQLRRETVKHVVDQVPLPPETAGARLFGGAFPLEVAVPGGTLRTVVEADLAAAPGTSRTTVSLSLTDLATPGQTVLATASATAIFPVEVHPVTGLDTTVWLVPVLALGAADWSVELSAPGWTPGQIATTELALRQALIHVLGHDLTLPIHAVRHVPGADSHDLRACPSPPQLCWIDTQTLGIFVMYRDVAVPDPARKAVSDLPSETVFVYQPQLRPALPARLDLSAAGFATVVRWPTVFDSCRQHIRNRRIQDAVRAADRGSTRIAILAEIEAAGTAAPSDTELDSKVESRVHTQAAADVDAWLESEPGHQAVRAEMPPPAGNSALTIVESPPARLTRLDLSLADGYIRAEIVGRATPPCGSITGRQTLRIGLAVGSDEISTHLRGDGDPDINVSAGPWCLAAAALFGGLMGGPIWALFGAGALSGAGSFLQWTISSAARNLVPHLVSQIDPLSVKVPTMPLPYRLTGADVTADGITVVAAVGVSLEFNDVRPVLDLQLTQTTLPLEPAIPYVEDNPARPWGCAPRTFTITTRLLSSQITVDLVSRHIPRPWQSVSWSLQSGQRTSEINPEPTWAALPVPVSGEVVTVSGPARMPDPRPTGSWVADLPVGLRVHEAGDRLVLEVPAGFGNRYLRVLVHAVDARGRVHEGETFVTVEHERSSFPADYDDYHRDCQDRLAVYLGDLTRKGPPIKLKPVEGRPGQFRVRPFEFRSLHRERPIP